MKNLKSLALTFMLIIFVANVNAQTEDNPWQISIGINARKLLLSSLTLVVSNFANIMFLYTTSIVFK